MSKFVLGVSGVARSGKDTVAGLLVAHYGFVRVSFAEPMRAMAAAIDPVVGFLHEPIEEGGDDVIRYNDAIEWLGYEQAKVEYPEVRRFLQRLGTEAGRKVLGGNFWVDFAMERAAPHERVVISDTRFKSEAQAVRAAGGSIIRVHRPGVAPANDHISERDLDDWKFDAYLNNSGSIAQIVPWLDQFFSRHAPQIVRSS